MDLGLDRPGLLPAVWKSIKSFACDNRVMLVAAVLHYAAAYGVAAWLGQRFASGASDLLFDLATVLAPLFLLVLLVGRFVYMAVFVRPEKPTLWLLRDVRDTVLEPGRVIHGVLSLTAIALMASAFTFIKDQIPLIAPFSWDPAFAAVDRALHGGHDPWRLLMPIFGTPLLTTALNAVYNAWFFVLFFVTFVACFGNPANRNHRTFLLAFVLGWIVAGNIAAILLSSAGPVYYAALGFGGDFQPQMDALHAFARTSPVWALDVQQMLLDGYRNEGPVKGISAMPSMHVVTCAIMAFYGFTLARWIGWLLTAFAALILIGSVHLAWHYAIDGYVGIALAVVIWFAARRLIGWTSPTRAEAGRTT